jgi:hypothetical protein
LRGAATFRWRWPCRVSSSSMKGTYQDLQGNLGATGRYGSRRRLAMRLQRNAPSVLGSADQGSAAGEVYSAVTTSWWRRWAGEQSCDTWPCCRCGRIEEVSGTLPGGEASGPDPPGMSALRYSPRYHTTCWDRFGATGRNRPSKLQLIGLCQPAVNKVGARGHFFHRFSSALSSARKAPLRVKRGRVPRESDADRAKKIVRGEPPGNRREHHDQEPSRENLRRGKTRTAIPWAPSGASNEHQTWPRSGSYPGVLALEVECAARTAEPAKTRSAGCHGSF